MARRRRSYDDFHYYPPSRPRAAEGGIKADSRRGGFGKSWWAKRWISVLEGFDIGARLGRGRSYARSGQVIDVAVGQGEVTARVQGSRAKPYAVTIRVKPLSPAQWKKVGKALSRQALFAAKLLAGEMPQDIESAFAEARLSLFPGRAGDLKTDCSCPDWSNPCKHIAAVYYLLGEEFDRDPFLIFKLRGLDREALTELLGGAVEVPGGEDEEPAVAELLPADPGAFWGGSLTRADGSLAGPVEVPSASAALLRRLGAFPFWRGRERPAEALESVYRAAALRGLEVLAGRPVPEPEPELELDDLEEKLVTARSPKKRPRQ